MSPSTGNDATPGPCIAAGADGGTAVFVGAGSWIWARASSTTVERPRSDLAPAVPASTANAPAAPA